MLVNKQSNCYRLLYVVCIVLVCCGISPAGGSREDYQRADQLWPLFKGKVFGQKVRPNWINDSMMWYRWSTGKDEYEFILVDAEKGECKRAFDHDKLAAGLVRAGIKRTKASCLLIQKLKFDLKANSLEFVCFGNVYNCNLNTYELELVGESDEDVMPNLLDFRRALCSSRKGPEVEVVFENRLEETVEVSWINSSCNPISYYKLKPGQVRFQNSYIGHVWQIQNSQGEKIGVYQVDGRQTKVLIGVENKTPQQHGPQKQKGADKLMGKSSPDGRWTALARDNNVFIVDNDSQKEYQLSTDGCEEDFYRDSFIFSPDSKKLIAVQEKVGQRRQIHIVESSPKDQLQPKLHTIGYYKPGDIIDVDRPVLFDLETQKQIPINNDLFSNPFFRIYRFPGGEPDRCEFGLNEENHYRWASDSSRFMFCYNQRGHQLMRIIGVDANTGKAKPIVEETSDTFICYSFKYYCNYLDDTNEIIWMSERDGWNHLYLYDSKAGKVKNQITKGNWVVRKVEYVDTDKRQIWFTAGGVYPDQDPYYLHYCRVNFDGSDFKILTKGNGTHTAKFSPDRKYLIDTYSRVDMPPVHELIRCSDGKSVCLLGSANFDDLIKTGWKPPIRFNAKGRDNTTDIYGMIIRPTNFDPAKKYPVIEDIYAGPQTSHVLKPFYSYSRDQWLAELGFIIVRIDGMGTIHRSKAFHDVCYKNIADAGLPDRIAWIKAAAQEYPWMDADRVGIFGGSAGGQNAAGAVMQYGDFYKAAVADCGCHDNRVDKIWWNEQWFGWPVGPEYEANSNVTLAKNLKGNLLLVVGEMDTNVDPASTMQVVDALIKADKDFDMLVIPGAGHGAAETRYGRRRRADYFVRHLLDVEPRW